eukprot:SAG31_NODE_1072_length_10065_cov_2.900662_5_plen_493_part_00
MAVAHVLRLQCLDLHLGRDARSDRGQMARQCATASAAAPRPGDGPQPAIVQLTAADFDDWADLEVLGFAEHQARVHKGQLRRIANHGPWGSVVARPDAMSNQYAMRQNGRLIAVVGVTERRWVISCGSGRDCSKPIVLRFAGIGNVCTHPSLGRGKGLFRQLMKHCLSEIQKLEYAGSFLGGDRQRYGYFGYEKTGTVYSYSISRTNCRRHFENQPSKRSCLKLELVDPADAATLAACRALQRGGGVEQLAFYDRDTAGYGPAESVVLYLPRIYAAIDHSASAASGPVLVGYLSVTEGSEDSVVELIGSSLTSELEMLQQWVLEHGRPSGRGNSHSDGNYSCALRLAPWRLKLIRQVGKFAERQVLETDHNWQIFDWRSTLTACFALKTAAMLPEWSTLVCGMVRLTIQDSGSFEILVRADNVVTVEQVPEFQIDVSTATLPHELIVEPREALRLAFGPAQPTAVLPIPSTLAPMLCSWFPLPLFTDGPDSV